MMVEYLEHEFLSDFLVVFEDINAADVEGMTCWYCEKESVLSGTLAAAQIETDNAEDLDDVSLLFADGTEKPDFS